MDPVERHDAPVQVAQGVAVDQEGVLLEVGQRIGAVGQRTLDERAPQQCVARRRGLGPIAHQHVEQKWGLVEPVGLDAERVVEVGGLRRRLPGVPDERAAVDELCSRLCIEDRHLLGQLLGSPDVVAIEEGTNPGIYEYNPAAKDDKRRIVAAGANYILGTPRYIGTSKIVFDGRTLEDLDGDGQADDYAYNLYTAPTSCNNCAFPGGVTKLTTDGDSRTAAWTSRDGFDNLGAAAVQDVVRLEHVNTARAKGLAERAVILKHVVRNALIPVVTLVALQMPAVFGGAIVTEQIFRIPGNGSLLIDAILRNDTPVIMSVTFVFACLVILFNLIADLLYGWLDPRISYR